MGDPRKQKKKYETPRFPWRSDALQGELRLIGEYGLRNKHELWRHRTMLSKFRGISRSVLGVPSNERTRMETQLLEKFRRLGVLAEDAVLDSVLDLTIEDILERRLQTIVFRKGLAKSTSQARQLITHGHIAIGDRKVFSPSYMVQRGEEEEVTYARTSPLSNPGHQLRSLIGEGAKQAGAER